MQAVIQELGNTTALGDNEYGGRISHSVSQMEKDELSGMFAGDYWYIYCANCTEKELRTNLCGGCEV